MWKLKAKVVPMVEKAFGALNPKLENNFKRSQ